MITVNPRRWRERAIGLMALVIALVLALPVLHAQTSGTGTQPQTQAPAQTPSNPSSDQDIPDAPSTVQPPPKLPGIVQRSAGPGTEPLPGADEVRQQEQEELQPPPKMPPVETIPPGSMPKTEVKAGTPRNQINPADDLYKISVTTNFVQIPVTVKDSQGRRVDGLLPKDFTVLENGKPQKLTYFSSDPFELSVAIVLDLGISDVALQKVNETYSALVGAFSPWDEYALYTYSSTVSQVIDFTKRPQRLTFALDTMKTVHGGNSGPPVLTGPLAMGPTVNGMPVGGPPVDPVITPQKEAHVLNDAILRAALDLSKRDRTRRKAILVISDGRERGSQANYREVLRVLQTHGIEVKAVVVDSSALPVFRQVEKVHHIWGQGYSNILPRYVSATGGGQIYPELTRNAIENAYTDITSDARNQYTLGWSPKAVPGSSAYRSIEVLVDRRDLDIYTKSGYYSVPSAH